MAPEADEALPPGDQRQTEPGDVSENQPGAAADWQLVQEEHPPRSLDGALEHVDGGGASVDIRAEHVSGQIIGQLFEAVQRHSGAPLSQEWVDNELKDYGADVGNEDQLRRKLQDNRVLVRSLTIPAAGGGPRPCALSAVSDTGRLSAGSAGSPG